MNKTFKEYEEENTIICPNCNIKIKTNIIPMNFFDNIHEDMYISHETEYLERKKLQQRIDKAIEVLTNYEEDFGSVYETSWFVNKNDNETTYSCDMYQKLLLNILKGEDDE